MLALEGEEFWRQTYDRLWFVISSKGLSVVAIDAAAGTLVGVWAVADDGGYDTMGCLHQDLDHAQVYGTRPSTSLLEALTGDHHNKDVADLLQTRHKNNRSTTGIVVEMLAIGVHQDFRRRGIGATMTELLLINIQNNGYKMAWSECSSHYSMKVLVNTGGRVENEIEYATFAIPGGGGGRPPSHPFQKKVQEPHDKIHLVVFRSDTLHCERLY